MSPASAETGQRGRNSEEASVGGKDAASLKQRMQSWLEQRAGERVQGGWGGWAGPANTRPQEPPGFCFKSNGPTEKSF